MRTLITYTIGHIKSESFQLGDLKSAVKLACDFWNKYVIPKQSIILHLSVFDNSTVKVVANSYEPFKKSQDKTAIHGNIELNANYLVNFNHYEIVEVIIHEIGHVLGIGGKEWQKMLDLKNKKFHSDYFKSHPDLEKMDIEMDYGPGVKLIHWDEEIFDNELMTGKKDKKLAYVLPVTIDVLSLLGHRINQRLEKRTKLSEIIDDLRGMPFLRQDDVEQLDKYFFKQTRLWEATTTDRRGLS